ncbi:MAG TPA: glycosyltransferase family 4 protein [Gemmatimonadaceae bacterium]
MRIVWLKAGKLLPVDTGGKIRSFNILRHLAARHEMTVVSYYTGAADHAYESALNAQFPGAECVAVPMGAGAVGQALHYAPRFLFRLEPYSVTKYTSPLVTARLRSVLTRRTPDVLMCDFLAASLNVPRDVTTPSALFQHNVESALWERQARYERNPIKRAVFAIEARKMLRYERATLARFDEIIAVSEHDKSQMHAMSPDAPITVVPTGVDVTHYRRPGHAVASATPRVTFLGSMDWPANIDGVEWFCDTIWPSVRARVPNAEFHVVGRNPPARITGLASDSVKIVGGVTSVLPDLHAASVFVVPLRIGGGTRLKIYEAMAASLPIVSTAVGAEGLEVSDGEDIVLEDDPSSFADAVSALLVDEERRARMGAAALATASRFDWSVIATDFEAVLRRAIVSAGRPPVRQSPS